MKVKLYQCGRRNERCITQYPLGLGYLKANAPTGVDVEIVSTAAKLANCDLVGLSTCAAGLREAIDVLRSVGDSIPVVVGGQGTLWEGLREFPFKHIVVGEGERAFVDIVEGTASKEQVLRYPAVKNLDDIRPPARGRCGNVVPIFTSRGCAYSCRFCSSRAFWDRVRYHSAGRVLAEALQVAREYPRAKMIAFFDDLSIADKARFDALHAGWMKARLNKRFALRAFVRANLLTMDVARKMKRMGFARVRFGAESASDRVLRLLGKRETVADYHRTISIARKVGLPVTASFMHGIPGETAAESAATLRFIEKYKGVLRVEGWYKFQPFPGTEFWDGRDPLVERMAVR